MTELDSHARNIYIYIYIVNLAGLGGGGWGWGWAGSENGILANPPIGFYITLSCFMYILYSKHLHIRTHDFGGQGDRVLI